MIRTVIKYTDNKILLNDAEVFETSKTLFPGLYDLEVDIYGAFKNFIHKSDVKYFPLMPSDELENVQDYIEIFFSKAHEDLCKRTGILLKGGLLLHGKQGIGKSNYVNYIVNRSIKEKEACVFNIDSHSKLSNIVPKIKELRDIQNNLFIIVLEEMDEILQYSGAESTLKNFMDGVNSVDNLLFLCTTNYIDKIPVSLRERPSRIKKCFEISQHSDTEKMKEWLTATYKTFFDDLSDEDCDKLHDLCLNKTVDEIKHILVDYKLNIKPLKEKKRLGFSRN